MNFLRLHWFDLGLVLAVVTGICLLVIHPTGFVLLLWLSLITLFLHQFEEYRYPGYFPGMMNTCMFASTQPDRYPLNTQTSLIVNVVEGWLLYFLAAVFNEKAMWLAIAATLVSAGNFIAHTLLFNIRGKTAYNPGMLTSIVFFLPYSVFFFIWVIQNQMASAPDWIVGVILGLAFNYIGVFKMIDLLKDKNTSYIFPARCLVPKSRNMATK